jgi:uncharacterized protein YecE (DUF72 family)
MKNDQSFRIKPTVRIGTSGWSYNHWIDVFYPPDLKSSEWLGYYSRYFDTVELNVTFYRTLPETTFLGWYQKIPADFMFAVKGSRFITHVKKLKIDQESLELFFGRAKLLKEKLGVVLWQLPPNFQANCERLEEFLKLTKKFTKSSIRQTFEFRHESWFNNDIYKVLEKYNAALCIADSKKFPCVEVITADFVYLRFHGRGSLYASKYKEKELEAWVQKIKNWQDQGKDIYAYFNNDAYGYAVEGALYLKGVVGSKK